MSDERVVDARGLRCPWPVIRLSRAAREMAESGKIRIRADDPLAPGELAALCAERGWRFEADPDSADSFEIVIRTAV
jgi:tRNA 2-thiouridine synthesizing protein A